MQKQQWLPFAATLIKDLTASDVGCAVSDHGHRRSRTEASAVGHPVLGRHVVAAIVVVAVSARSPWWHSGRDVFTDAAMDQPLIELMVSFDGIMPWEILTDLPSVPDHGCLGGF